MKKLLIAGALSMLVTPFSNVYALTKDKGAGWSKICDSWIGSDINELIRKWGIPQSEYRMPNGHKIYQWKRVSSYSDPPDYAPDGLGGYYSIGGGTMTFVCNTQFTANQNGVVYDWKWDGNNC